MQAKRSQYLNNGYSRNEKIKKGENNMSKLYMNIRYDEENDILNIEYSAKKEELKKVIATLMALYYERNGRDLIKMFSLVSEFNKTRKDTSNITEIVL